MSKIIASFVISLFMISFSFIGAEAEEGPSSVEGKKIYMHYCASCHGDKGDGKGFNAKNLDPRPANHTDAVFMSNRTDRELADAVSGGGRAIGKATLMPPWGNTLDKAQIRSLVLYLRNLCMCQEEK